MRSKGHARSKTGMLLVAALVASVLLAVAPAFAEPPFASYTKPAPESRRWMLATAEYAPYTEYSSGEAAALAAAQAVLADLPWGLVRNADHGYDQCAEMLEKMRVLRDAQPVIVGHEVVLSAPDREARVFVYNDGVVRLLASGDGPTHAEELRQVTGDGERHAWQVAHSAMCLHAGLEPDSPYCSVMGSIAAYGVGFALEDGTHLVIRVDHEGSVSCPTW